MDNWRYGDVVLRLDMAAPATLQSAIEMQSGAFNANGDSVRLGECIWPDDDVKREVVVLAQNYLRDRTNRRSAESDNETFQENVEQQPAAAADDQQRKEQTDIRSDSPPDDARIVQAIQNEQDRNTDDSRRQYRAALPDPIKPEILAWLCHIAIGTLAFAFIILAAILEMEPHLLVDRIDLVNGAAHAFGIATVVGILFTLRPLLGMRNSVLVFTLAISAFTTFITMGLIIPFTLHPPSHHIPLAVFLWSFGTAILFLNLRLLVVAAAAPIPTTLILRRF